MSPGFGHRCPGQKPFQGGHIRGVNERTVMYLILGKREASQRSHDVGEGVITRRSEGFCFCFNVNPRQLDY